MAPSSTCEQIWRFFHSLCALLVIILLFQFWDVSAHDTFPANLHSHHHHCNNRHDYDDDGVNDTAEVKRKLLPEELAEEEDLKLYGFGDGDGHGHGVHHLHHHDHYHGHYQLDRIEASELSGLDWRLWYPGEVWFQHLKSSPLQLPVSPHGTSRDCTCTYATKNPGQLLLVEGFTAGGTINFPQ